MSHPVLEGFRLSPQQKQLWLQQQSGRNYVAQTAILLTGQLNLNALQAAIQNIVNRHEILRTTFHSLPGVKTPIQVIQDNGIPGWKTLDFQKYQSDEQLREIEQYLIQERHLINNLSESSSLQISLLILSEQKHLLVLTLPALCADGWTLNNLFSEISQTYSFCLENQDLEAVFEEPIQYIQFSEWQNQLLEEEEAEAGKEFWQQPDFELKSPLILPLETCQTQEKESTIAINCQILSAELTAKLTEVSTQYQTTPANILLTCWQTLLWRLTQQSNFITYAILNDRKYEELEELFGLAAKSLPVPCVFQQDFKFLEVLNQVTERINQIQKWQDYYIEPENTAEITNIGFEFQELPADNLVGNLSFSIYHHVCCFAPFKLKLIGLQHESKIRLELHFDQHLFDSETIQRLLNNLITLVTDAVHQLNATVAKLNILNCKEHQLLIEFNKTQKHYPTLQSIHQLFEQQVEKTPEDIAVVFDNETLTYSQLNIKVNQLAHYLQKLGVGADDLVGLYVERSLDIIVGIFGILKAGAAYLPLDSKLPAENLAFRLQDAQTSIVLTQQSLIATVPNTIAQIICLDTNWEMIAQESKENPQNSVQPEHLVYAIFTSGSTGQPKAVAIEHQQLINYLYGILDRIDFPPSASFATVSTFAADLGNTMIFTALCTGGCLHILPQEIVSDAQAIASYFQRYPIDYLKIVPSHLKALLTANPHPSILPEKCLILGGETSSWELIQTVQKLAPNCQIFNHYGPTETTVGVLTYPIEIPHPQAKTVPLGKPLPNTQIFVLDSLLKPVPIGVPGELYIGGTCLARGYLNRPELTQEKFIQNPFLTSEFPFSNRLYKTGDLVRYLPDGNLEFLGRVDNQIKIRGFRVELGEIEAILQQHSQVQTAVVLAEADQQLVAYIVPNSAFVYHPKQQSELINNLRNFGLQKLPDYMLPSAFVLLKALPLTPNGKVDRQALSKLEKIRSVIDQTSTPPQTLVEKQLAEIWQDLLKLDPVGIEDNFFDLGGHSLLVTQLLAKIRKAFEINLDLRELFNAPTIAELAKIIENKTVGVVAANSSVNLLEEAVLDPTIYPKSPIQYPDNPQSILLTGATGFLGVFLLRELLQQTVADIYCLVRSEDQVSGQERLIQSLKSYQVWDEKFSNRIIPVLGDLAQPLLGLSEEQFQNLACKIDVIYHNGAWVNFTYPYSVLKSANVLGTQEVLRMATQIKVKQVHFISTIGVAKIQDQSDSKNKTDQGYTESKWVAEKLVKIAGERGVPITIYRPGRISGDSQTGVCNPEDHTFRMIRGCIQLGSVPQQNVKVNLTPVDYASQAIVYLSQQESSLNRIFDIVNPQSIAWNDLADLITSLGYPLQQMPYEDWRQKLIKISETETNNALYPLISIFSEVSEDANSRTSPSYASQSQNIQRDLAESGIICPPVNRQLLETYFSYLVEKGFLS